MTTQPTPELPIGSIVVGKRHRTDPGDIKGLADSIDTIGLIHPIVVTPDYRLIAGQRRLLALNRLGWDSVPVNVIHTLNGAVDELLAERDENVCRKAMTVSEMAALGAALEELERPENELRRREGARVGSERAKAKRDGSPLSPPGDKGLDLGKRERTTVHKVGEALGVSSTTYSRIKDVYRTATGQTDASQEEVEVAKQALAQADKGALSITAAHEAVREGALNRQKGMGHEKRQLRALEGVKPQLSGVATALEVVFDGGFEKTCTRAIALEYAKMFKAELNRINRLVSRLEKYGKEV
jgi:ParB-like chromosome segregation protein Spo0J